MQYGAVNVSTFWELLYFAQPEQGQTFKKTQVKHFLNEIKISTVKKQKELLIHEESNKEGSLVSDFWFYGLFAVNNSLWKCS